MPSARAYHGLDSGHTALGQHSVVDVCDHHADHVEHLDHHHLAHDDDVHDRNHSDEPGYFSYNDDDRWGRPRRRDDHHRDWN